MLLLNFLRTNFFQITFFCVKNGINIMYIKEEKKKNDNNKIKKLIKCFCIYTNVNVLNLFIYILESLVFNKLSCTI